MNGDENDKKKQIDDDEPETLREPHAPKPVTPDREASGREAAGFPERSEGWSPDANPIDPRVFRGGEPWTPRT